jgi:hypothetical protein
MEGSQLAPRIKLLSFSIAYEKQASVSDSVEEALQFRVVRSAIARLGDVDSGIEDTGLG